MVAWSDAAYPPTLHAKNVGPRLRFALCVPAASLQAMVRLVEGQIVGDDEGEGSSGGFLTRVLRCRGDTTINLLGFRVPLYWTCVIAVFATLRFGVPGLVFFGILAGEMSEVMCAWFERSDLETTVS